MSMTPEVQDALKRYLLTIADDEMVIGLRDVEWTGIAPMLEEDVAFSSLAQDEIGHARLCYTLAANLAGEDPDHLAFLRPTSAYYCAHLLERRTTLMYDPAGNHTGEQQWALAVARRFLYDQFDALRIESLTASTYAPLANAMQKVAREEKYHLWHGETWWKALASASLDARTHLEKALQELWPAALGLFEEVPGEALLQAEGIITKRTSELLDPWLDSIQAACAQYHLPFPASRVDGRWIVSLKAENGGRMGEHSPAWDELYAEMTMARQPEPEGVW